jgi:hypothetical protein
MESDDSDRNRRSAKGGNPETPKVRKSRKPAAKRGAKKEEITEGLIVKLPGDALRNIAMGMDYPDIIHWCQTAKKFNNLICNDTMFWNNKLRQDFPEKFKDLSNKDDAKNEYALAYANMLDEKADRYYRNRIPENDPEFAELEKKFRALNIEFEKLKVREKELRKQKTSLTRKYEKKVTTLKKQALSIRKQARSKTPRKMERKYKEIELNYYPYFIEELEISPNLLGATKTQAKQLHLSKLELLENNLRFIARNQVINLPEFNEGDIIGFHVRSSDDPVPDVILYVYRDKDGELTYKTFTTRHDLDKTFRWLETNVGDTSDYYFPFVLYDYSSEEENESSSEEGE